MRGSQSYLFIRIAIILNGKYLAVSFVFATFALDGRPDKE